MAVVLHVGSAAPFLIALLPPFPYEKTPSREKGTRKHGCLAFQPAWWNRFILLYFCLCFPSETKLRPRITILFRSLDFLDLKFHSLPMLGFLFFHYMEYNEIYGI
jgi:hypothetical protein